MLAPSLSHKTLQDIVSKLYVEKEFNRKMNEIWNKICCIFGTIETNEIMKTLKFKISPETIRKANYSLVVSGINLNVRNSYSGVITARTTLNGIVQIREISKEKINEAYGKSLKEYAEKL